MEWRMCREGRGSVSRERIMGVTMAKKLRGQVLLAFVGLLLILVGCSSESPTAPSGGNGGGGGSTTPPTAAEITLVVGNATPLVSSTSTITATVRQNNQNVPNGTAVEFTTTLGTFVDTASSTTVRTTTDGVATATLTSSTPGTATVTARVNNVSRTTTVTFQPGGGNGGSTAPTITSIDPATGRPSGGSIVTIRGTNFVAPVRVLFGTVQATVVSVTPTEIQAIVPAVNLGATEETREVNVTVITRAGTAEEASVVAPTRFRYELEILTPVVYSVAPASGPNEGNTRITILGEGFQAPVRVFFGTDSPTSGPLADQVELQVLQVNFGQIIALTPPALGLGAELRDQQVSLRVLNVAGNRDTISPRAFRYGPGMAITAAGPTQGSAVGGTRITIDGWGFDDPVTVTVAGVAAQVISVSGSQIVAITSQTANPCAGVSGPIVVTNVEDGSQAAGPAFTYIAQEPVITALSPASVGRSGVVSVTVASPGTGNIRFRLDDQILFSTPAVSTDAIGPTTFTFTVPSDFEFDTEACTVGTAEGERAIPTRVDVTFQNVTTGCEETLPDAVTITPTAEEAACVAPGVAAAIPEAQAMGTVTVGTTVSREQQVCNTGGASFDITGVTITGANATEFGETAPAPPITVAPTACTTFNVTFTPATAGAKAATLNVTTTVNSLAVALTGTGQ